MKKQSAEMLTKILDSTAKELYCQKDKNNKLRCQIDNLNHIIRYLNFQNDELNEKLQKTKSDLFLTLDMIKEYIIGRINK